MAEESSVLKFSTKFGVEIFDRVAWAFGPCIAA
jgi:hypothetical protein